MADACALCGRTREATDRDAVGAYCSAGCRDVAERLDPVDDPTPTGTDEPRDGDGEATYLRVDGMYSATCEAYLESVATGLEGVSGADASYVTETVRVSHDSEVVSAESLREALSRLGYTAYLRSDASAEGASRDGATRRSREMSGLRRRRDETILGLRYAAGVVFGAFLLVPYMTLLYPAYLAPFVDIWIIDRIGQRLSLDGAGGVAFLRLYFVATAAVLVFTGLPLLRGAYTSLRMRRPTTDLLVSATVLAAFVYGTVAVLLGRVHVYFDMTLVVASLVTGAGYYRAAVKRRALKRLTDLTVSQVDTARRYHDDGDTETVPVEAVEPGEALLVRAGERVPVDGHLLEGSCTVQEAVVTGEALPVRKAAGDDLVGGSVVTDSPAVMAAGADAASSLERLTTAVWDVQSARHGDERRADRYAARAAPVVAALAAVAGLTVGVLSGPGAGVLAALLAVIVASPWALGLAAPLSVAANLRDALAAGVVVFDETVFGRLRDVEVVVFDKTGTLTTGEMDVVDVDVPADLRAATVALERRAAHPVARAVVEALVPDDPGDGDEDVAVTDGGLTEGVREFTRHGTGVEGVVDGERVLVGTPGLFEAEGWTVDADIADRAARARAFGQVPVVVGRDGAAEGLVVVGDEPRDGWADVLDSLSARGLDVVVLTGDHADATGFLAEHDAVTDVFAGVPPEGKAAAVRRLAADRSVAMVGDGTNDALALAAADLGVSLGGGTALAADAADVAVLDDELGGVETAFALAAGAERRVRQNTVAALGYNALVVPLALLGLLNPLFAMVAVVLAASAIGINSSRSLH